MLKLPSEADGRAPGSGEVQRNEDDSSLWTGRLSFSFYRQTWVMRRPGGLLGLGCLSRLDNLLTIEFLQGLELCAILLQTPESAGLSSK